MVEMEVQYQKSQYEGIICNTQQQLYKAIIILSVVMPNAVMLNVIMLNVVMLSNALKSIWLLLSNTVLTFLL